MARSRGMMPRGARATMQHLLSESHEFMNRHIHALPRPEPENP